MMASRMECKKITKQALAHLRGETSQVAQQRFMTHLDLCEKCETTVRQMSQLTETTRAQRFLPTPEVRNSMLHSLMDRIEAADEDEQIVSETPRWRPRFAFVLIPAAAALVAFGLSIWVFNEQDPQSPEAEQVGPPASGIPARVAMETKLLAPDLTVGVEAGSRWMFKEDAASYDLTVEQGRLWIKFSNRQKERTLAVHGAGVAVQVTGTVLLVDARPGQIMEVGVYEGQVEVVPDVGESATVGEGELRVSDGRVVVLDRGSREDALTWLARLDDASGNDLVPTEDGALDQPVEPSVEDLDPGPRARDLYAKAEHEMASGDFKKAARYLERLISASPDASKSDTARLDLARLYAKQLNAPKKAARHLSTYLRRHPGGAKAKLARQMLCDLRAVHGLRVNVECPER